MHERFHLGRKIWLLLNKGTNICIRNLNVT